MDTENNLHKTYEKKSIIFDQIGLHLTHCIIFWHLDLLLVTENDRSCIRFNYGRLLFNLIILYLHDNYRYICSNPPPKGVLKLPYWSNFPSNMVSKTPVNQKFDICLENSWYISCKLKKKKSLSAMIIDIPFGYYIRSELCRPIFRTVQNFSM